LICSCCLILLNGAYELRGRSRNAEKFYFGKLRNKLRDRNREQAAEEGDGECSGTEEDYQESTCTNGFELDDVTMEEEEMETAVNDENLAEDLAFFIESQRDDVASDELRYEPHNEGVEFDNYEIIEEESGNGCCGKVRFVEVVEEDVENNENDSNLANNSLEPPKKKKKNPVVANKKKSNCIQPVKCQICNKILSNKYYLTEHINAVHEKKRPYSCYQCSKSFYRKHTLVNHISHRHTFTNDDLTNSNRPFKCDFQGCGKFFKTKSTLKLHQRVHSGKF
jgi:Zinc finger, C2H2 type